MYVFILRGWQALLAPRCWRKLSRPKNWQIGQVPGKQWAGGPKPKDAFVILQCKQWKELSVHSPAPCNSALFAGWHAAVCADVSMNWQRGFTRRLLAQSQKQGSGRQRGTEPEERDTASLPMTQTAFTSPEIHIVYSQKHFRFPWIHNFMISVWRIQSFNQYFFLRFSATRSAGKENYKYCFRNFHCYQDIQNRREMLHPF